MTLSANANGNIQGQFTIPANVPTGTKLVEFVGSQGHYVSTTYTNRGDITTEERRRVFHVLTRGQPSFAAGNRYDPLAQTFTLTQGRHIGGLDLWFSNVGVSRVTVQIRETSLGLPTQAVLAESSLLPASMNNNSHTRFTWSPVWLEAGEEYAIVILTDDANAAVRIAEVGLRDNTEGRWVSSQPYQVGVLLSSSNASTWTAHQTQDLTFRLLAARFSSNTSTVSIGNVSATNASDVIALANIERVGTETDIKFTLSQIDPNGTTITQELFDDLPVTLRARINGAFTVQAHLTGSETRSPVLYPGVQVVFGNLAATADYVTRAIAAGTSVKVTVIYEVLLVGNATVVAQLEDANGNWQNLPAATTRAVDHGWMERTHIQTAFTASQTRLKLTLNGDIANRPKVRSLRIMIT